MLTQSVSVHSLAFYGGVSPLQCVYFVSDSLGFLDANSRFTLFAYHSITWLRSATHLLFQKRTNFAQKCNFSDNEGKQLWESCSGNATDKSGRGFSVRLEIAESSLRIKPKVNERN